MKVIRLCLVAGASASSNLLDLMQILYFSKVLWGERNMTFSRNGLIKCTSVSRVLF